MTKAVLSEFSSATRASIRGLSTLDVLVGLAISVPIMFAAAKGSTLSHSELLKAREVKEDISAIGKTAAFLNLAIRAQDAHPLPAKPVLHKNGSISFPDGSKSPIMTGPLGRRPRQGSDALSYFRSPILGVLRAEFKRGGVSMSSIRVCRIFKDYRTSSAETFIALTPSGIFEGLKVGRGIGTRKCGGLNFKLIDSIVLGAPPAELRDSVQKSVMFLIPIEESFTIYLARDSTLRFAKHRGKSLIENQPIATGLSGLRLKFNDSGSLRAIITLAGGLEKSLSIRTRMPRLPLSEIIFNL